MIYQICENNATPVNCDTAIATIEVGVPDIVAGDDDFSDNPINGYVGGIAGNLLDDDFVTGLPVLPEDVDISIIDNGGIDGVSVDTSGNVIVPPGTAPSTYVVTYQICEVLNPSNCDVAEIIIVVGCDPFEVYNVITPNGDGNNDLFIIKNIEFNTCYRSNIVEIYNRWGVLVYLGENYDNVNVVFYGVSNGRTVINRGQNLPDGTYFYIIKIVDNDNNLIEKNGWLQIIR